MPARTFGSLDELQKAGTRGWRARRDRARDRQDYMRSDERNEANRARQAIINEVDRFEPLARATARRDRAAAEVDRLALSVAGYKKQALEIGKITDGHTSAVARLSIAQNLLDEAEVAVAAELAKVTPEPVAEPVAPSKGKDR